MSHRCSGKKTDKHNFNRNKNIDIYPMSHRCSDTNTDKHNFNRNNKSISIPCLTDVQIKKRKLTPACVLDDCDVDDGLARPAAKAKKKAAPKASTGPVAKAKAANGATKAKVLRDKASATEELRLLGHWRGLGRVVVVQFAY